MSHFVVGVILPDGIKPENDDDAAELIEPLLAPYNENTEVEEYDEKCYCVGRAAKGRAREQADKEVSTFDALRDSFWAAHPDADRSPFSDDPEIDEAWKKHIQARVAKEDELFEAQADKDDPQSDCDECAGKGVVKSTYNPKSKWDWYVVGGRWSGALPGTRNVAPVSELDGYTPFALVTPDMGWLEKAKMGWWAMTSNDMPVDDWKKIVHDSYEAFKDNYIVLVDCHI